MKDRRLVALQESTVFVLKIYWSWNPTTNLMPAMIYHIRAQSSKLLCFPSFHVSWSDDFLKFLKALTEKSYFFILLYDTQVSSQIYATQTFLRLIFHCFFHPLLSPLSYSTRLFMYLYEITTSFCVHSHIYLFCPLIHFTWKSCRFLFLAF